MTASPHCREGKSLVNITLANTGTVICFRTANPEDERLILPQFQPYVEKGEIASLPSFRFYMRLGALNPEEPFSGETVLTEIGENNRRVREVIESSRKQYAIKYVKKNDEEYKKSYTARKKQGSFKVVGSVLP